MTAIAILAALLFTGAAFDAAPDAVAQQQSIHEENIAHATRFFDELSRKEAERRAKEPVVHWIVRDADSGTWRPAPAPQQ